MGSSLAWRGWRPAAVCATLILAAMLLLPGCARTPPEQALRAAMDDLSAAVESRDAAAVQRHLAEDFVGPDGMDRDGARRLAALSLMRHASIGVTLGPLDLAIQDEHATVRFSAALSGGSGRLLPDSARIYQVETGWRLQGGQWRMTSARWSPAL